MTGRTGNEDYDAILERVAELKAEYRAANPPLPALPPGFSVDLSDNIRMKVQFERVTARAREPA